MTHEDFIFLLTGLSGLPFIIIGVQLGVFTWRALIVLPACGFVILLGVLIVRHVSPDFLASYARPVFHLGAAIILVVVGLVFTRETLLLVLASLLTIATVGVVVERRGIRSTFDRHVICNNQEERSYYIASAFWLLSSFVVVSLFPLSIALSSLLILGFGDPAASLVGRRLARIGDDPMHKTKLGSLAFLACSFVAASSIVPPCQALFGAIAGSLTEFYCRRLDDNLVIPMSAATAMYVLMFWNVKCVIG